jgi:toxin ParE1/3/4
VATVRKREVAKRDLIAQWIWYAENASVETADRFLHAAEETVAMLSLQPEAGYRIFVRRPELQGRRRFPLPGTFGKILLFYFPIRDGIEIVRVVDGDRNVERLLMEGFFGQLNRPYGNNR